MDDASIEYCVPDEGGATLDEKVAFLSRSDAYALRPDDVICRETHMSWIFLAGGLVYKLKKPVRFAYLDFSTLARREAACRAELRLNRRLAPDIYLDVVPLRLNRALTLCGEGRIVDWLVVMRRLDAEETLEAMIQNGTVTPGKIDPLATLLARFYRRAAPVRLSGPDHLRGWQNSIAENSRLLRDPRFGLPAGAVRSIERAQRRFLLLGVDMLRARLMNRRILDGHGDLRPEHIWLDAFPRIIDCLEFNARLRAVDPFDEIAYLDVECTRLGAPWIGAHMRRRLAGALNDEVPQALFLFYRCYRATLRARLSVAHLLSPHPRTPEKWPPLTRLYLAQALRDAIALERVFQSASRSASGRLSCSRITAPAISGALASM